MKGLTKLTGEVQNRKNGLVIQGEKDYFIKNPAICSDSLYGKLVKVSGVISTSTNNAVLPPSDDGIIRQGIVTNSWEEYERINKQYWIVIKTIELAE